MIVKINAIFGPITVEYDLEQAQENGEVAYEMSHEDGKLAENEVDLLAGDSIIKKVVDDVLERLPEDHDINPSSITVHDDYWIGQFEAWYELPVHYVPSSK